MARLSIRSRCVAFNSSAANEEKIGLDLTLDSYRRRLPRRLLAPDHYLNLTIDDLPDFFVGVRMLMQVDPLHGVVVDKDHGL